MTVIPDILTANAEYAATFAHGTLPRPPARKVAILTCLDARIDPCHAFGLEPGDANVIRNAGGRATDDVIRSLIIAQMVLGVREVLVIHHTDCGLEDARNDQLRALVSDRLGADASEIDFLPFGNLEDSVREDVEAIRQSPYISPELRIAGFVYDVATGRLTHVV